MENFCYFFVSLFSALISVFFFFPFLRPVLDLSVSKNKNQNLWDRLFHATRGIDVYLVGAIFYPFVDLAQLHLSQLIFASMGHGISFLSIKIFSAFVTGAVSAIFFNPFKVALIRMQKQKDESFFVALKNIIQKQGIGALYSGSFFFSIRNAFYATSLFQISNLIPNFFYFSCFLAALFSIFFTLPLDYFSSESILNRKAKHGIKYWYFGFTNRFSAHLCEFLAFNYFKTQLSQYC